MLHLLPSPGVTNDIENGDYVSARGRAIANKCTSVAARISAGGWAKAGMQAKYNYLIGIESKADRKPGAVNKILGVFLYGPNSDFERFLTSARIGTLNSQGAIDFTTVTVPQEPEGYSSPDTSGGQKPPTTKPAGSCKASCAHWTDCSAEDDCVCKPDLDDPNNIIRGTGFPGWSGTTLASFGTFKCHPKSDLKESYRGYAAQVSVGHGRHLLEVTGNATGGNATVGNTWEKATSPILLGPCPCNCTYVSDSCCTSDTRIVYEETALQMPTVLLGEAGQCCNKQTGNWTSGPTQSSSDPTCYATAKRSTRSVLRGDAGLRPEGRFDRAL